MDKRQPQYVKSRIKNDSGSDDNLAWDFGTMKLREHAHFKFEVDLDEVGEIFYHSFCSCTKELKYEDGTITGYLDLGLVGAGPDISRTFKVRFFPDEPEFAVEGQIGRKNLRTCDVTFTIKGKLED